MKNTRDALSQLYAILRDLEKQKSSPNEQAVKVEDQKEDDIKGKAMRLIKKES
jgi:hypothetical protein